MALQANTLVSAMTTAGQTLGGTLWNDIQTFAIPELQKIATQIVAIEANLIAYTEDGARALLDMQVRASIGVIVAMTTLTLLAVQAAINQILAAVKTMVNKSIGFALLA